MKSDHWFSLRDRFVSHLRNVKNRHGRYARCIYVGLEKPDNSHSFDECRLGKAGELLPGLFAD